MSTKILVDKQVNILSFDNNNIRTFKYQDEIYFVICDIEDPLLSMLYKYFRRQASLMRYQYTKFRIGCRLKMCITKSDLRAGLIYISQGFNTASKFIAEKMLAWLDTLSQQETSKPESNSQQEFYFVNPDTYKMLITGLPDYEYSRFASLLSGQDFSTTTHKIAELLSSQKNCDVKLRIFKEVIS